MKAVYLKNFRKGFATNSSSTHSVIYQNKDALLKDLNIFELNYYDRFDSTIAASKDAKIKYVAANIFYNKKLFEVMCAFYPEMKQYKELAEKEIKENDGYFGMGARGRLYFDTSDNFEASIDYLRNIIDNDEIVIVGGSDEEDFVYETKRDHVELPEPDEVGNGKLKIPSVVKNGNYWVGYGWDGKVRYMTEKGDCIPEYPELIDICITKKCQWNCPMCYMNANMDGKHADLGETKNIIRNLSTDYRGQYKKRIEFSVGGGNVLLYPHLDELFKYMTEEGHIVNTTINAQDTAHLLTDDKLKKTFTDYVSAIGVSVCNDKDIDLLNNIDFKQYFKEKQITIHLIPEMLGVEKTKKMVEKLNSIGYYSLLFLGYKTNGRGATQQHTVFTDQDLNDLLLDKIYTSVDTTFANTYKEWLDKNFETEHTVTLFEGEYSMFIDAVDGIAYKSSYQLDKPYGLIYTTYDEHLTKWFTPIEAFAKIREDNGFKSFSENKHSLT